MTARAWSIQAREGWHYVPRRRPGVPLGLAGLALCTAVGLFGWTIVSAATTQSPILLMIGLPGSSVGVFALPWLGVLCLAWGGHMLLFGAEKPERHTAYAINLWIVLAAGAMTALLLAMFGLLVPDLI